MKVVAFLENMWFKDPIRAKKILEMTEKKYPGEGREKFIAAFLFFGCKTGSKILSAFGEDMKERIIWEETSKEIGSLSGEKFLADLDHMEDVLWKHTPDIIITFGKTAQNGMIKIRENYCRSHQWLLAPHPCARGFDTMIKLRETAKELRKLIGDKEPDECYALDV